MNLLIFSKIWGRITNIQINTSKLALYIFTVILGVHLIFYFQLKFRSYVFDTISVPDELKKAGISEEYLAHYIDLMVNNIVNFEKPIRNAQVESNTTEDVKLSNTQSERSNLNEIPISSDALGIAITFKQLAYLTDKIFSLMGYDGKSQYISLHFYLKDQNLELSSFFKNKIKSKNVRYDKENINRNDSIYFLCYQTAIQIVEEVYPDKLAEYYYNTGDLTACMKVCVYTLSKMDPNMNQDVVANLYNYWALCLTYNQDFIHFPTSYENIDGEAPTKEQGQEIINKLDIAIKKSSQNNTLFKINKAYVLYFLNYDPDYLNKFLNELIVINFNKLPQREKLAIQIAYFDIKLSLKANGDDLTKEFYTDSIFIPIQNMQKENEGKIESEQYFLIAQSLSNYSYLNPEILQFAINNYKMAIQLELLKKNGSPYKLSEYYNSLAFTYERVAMGTRNINSASFEDFANVPDTLLNKIKFNVAQAINYYPQNPWPYTTLAEYWAIQGIKVKIDAENKNNLEYCTAQKCCFDRAIEACRKAQKRGVNVHAYESYEPYKQLFIYNNNLKEILLKESNINFDMILSKLNMR